MRNHRRSETFEEAQMRHNTEFDRAVERHQGFHRDHDEWFERHSKRVMLFGLAVVVFYAVLGIGVLATAAWGVSVLIRHFA